MENSKSSLFPGAENTPCTDLSLQERVVCVCARARVRCVCVCGVCVHVCLVCVCMCVYVCGVCVYGVCICMCACVLGEETLCLWPKCKYFKLLKGNII